MNWQLRWLFCLSAGWSLIGCSLTTKTPSSTASNGVKVFDARSASFDMAAYQQAYNDYLAGKSATPPIAINLQITDANGGQVLGTMSAGVTVGTLRLYDAAPPQTEQQSPIPPGDPGAIAKECLTCPAPTPSPSPGTTPVSDPTPSASPSVTPTADPTQTVGAIPTATGALVYGADLVANNLNVNAAPPPPACLGGPPNERPPQCPAGTWPVVQLVYANGYWALMSGCTNGQPASACDINFNCAGGVVSCQVDLVTGTFACVPSTNDVCPISGWVCL